MQGFQPVRTHNLYTRIRGWGLEQETIAKGKGLELRLDERSWIRYLGRGAGALSVCILFIFGKKIINFKKDL